MQIVDIKKLENLLQTNWARFLDTTQLMRYVLEHVRDTTFRILPQAENHSRQIKIVISKLKIRSDSKFETWIEFSVPKNEGIVIGTLVATLSLDGSMEVTESFGTEFRPESLKQHPES